ncbi:acyltransferase family protein [Brackiella oedipodis]|uniref:acyltransferase family protein n=1 Tax=Brackiella oedipodis TaxID=124225 RepID=UPI00048C4653|nr:acyltransferase [Brackiella oedipodis]
MRIKSYDCLRVLSFLCIVIYHSQFHTAEHYGYFDWMEWMNLGGIGVTFFIVISGCSLALSAHRQSSIGDFYRRRFSSILPFYWVAYVFVLVFLFVTQGETHMEGKITKILLSVFALDGYMSSTRSTYYLVGEWFTGFIVLLYLFSPLLIKGSKRRPVMTLVIVTVISWLSINYSGFVNHYVRIWSQVGLWNPTSRMFEFVAGILITLYLIHHPQRLRLVAVLCLLYVLIAVFVLQKSFLLNLDLFALSIWVATFIVLLAIIEAIPIGERAYSVIEVLSKYSFMAFLYHHQVLLFLLNHLQIKEFAPIHMTYIIVSTIAISYFISYLTYTPAAAIKKLFFKKV